MNVFKISLLLAVMLGISACSKDDERTVSESNIIGTWNVVHASGWNYEDGKKVDEWSNKVYTNNVMVYIRENGNGQLYYRYLDYSFNINWELHGKYLTTEATTPNYTFERKFKITNISGTTMTWVHDDDEYYLKWKLKKN